MSWLNCDNCGKLINTDDHPEAWREPPGNWLCDDCFDKEQGKADCYCALETFPYLRGFLEANWKTAQLRDNYETWMRTAALLTGAKAAFHSFYNELTLVETELLFLMQLAHTRASEQHYE